MNENEFEAPGGPERRSDAETAQAAATDIRDSAKETVRETGERLSSEARSRADDAKAGVADEISSVSKALRTASEELRHGSPQERTFGMVASNLADFADVVREKDLSELVDDMSGFARRNPVAFLGGAALLGFAGVRMAKASRRARLSDDDPYGISTVPSSGTGRADVTADTTKFGRAEGSLS